MADAPKKQDATSELKDAVASMADAVAEGVAKAQEKTFRFVSDPSVEPMFTVVTDKETGEYYVRENATGKLSKVQMRSIEEEEAALREIETEEA